MIAVKVQCGCGQKYAFDVEPVGGRMPSPVACPVCAEDGTSAANEIIAQRLAAPTPAAPASAVKLSMPVSSPAVSAAAPAPPRATSAFKDLAGLSDGEKWKWWYFVLAGICIGGYSIWQAYDQHRIKPLGELFFAVLCVAIGIWDFQHKRKKKTMGV
jgi:hypothetical protein